MSAVTWLSQNSETIGRLLYWLIAGLVGLVLVAGLVRTIRKGTSRMDDIGDLDEVAERDEAEEERKRR
jgi:hypothetical protein